MWRSAVNTSHDSQWRCVAEDSKAEQGEGGLAGAESHDTAILSCIS